MGWQVVHRVRGDYRLLRMRIRKWPVLRLIMLHVSVGLLSRPGLAQERAAGRGYIGYSGPRRGVPRCTIR
jgi:hypothetical protein